MGLRKVTDPALLDMLNASSEPTLPERKGEADITQSGASAANATASAAETNALLPSKTRKAAAEATSAEAQAKIDTDKVEKHENADVTAATRLRTVIDKIDNIALDAADNNGWFETGASGAFARNLPAWSTLGATQPAHDIAANLETIDANTAFSELQKMRDNSPTGGALGQVTEKELDLLRSSVANLDPNQGHAQFLSNLGAAKKSYLDMLRRLDPAAADEYNARKGIRWERDKDGKEGIMYLSPVDGGDSKNRIDPFGVLGPDGGAPGGDGGDAGGGGGGGGPAAPSGGGDGGGFFGVNSLAELGKGLGEGAGSIAEAVGSVPGMLGGNMLGQGLYNIAGYGDHKYDMGESLRNLLGLPKNTHDTADTIIKGGTAALTGSVGAKGIGALLQPGTAKNVLATLSTSPLRDAAAGAAAGGGAELAKSMGGGPIAQTGAALAAGTLGYGGASGVNSLMTPKVPTRMAQLAEKYDVNLLPADTGSPVAKIITGAAKLSPISATPVVNAAKESQSGLAAAASGIARKEAGGDIPTTDVSGQWLKDAARRYSAKTRDVSNSLYEKAWADPIASQLKVPSSNAIAKVDEMLARLNKAPETNAGAINDLTKIRRDLSRGMTPEALHDLRSEISQGVYNGNLRSTKDQGRMKAIGGAISDDMLGYLDNLGLKPTANKIRRADAYHSERAAQIDEVLQPIIGKDEAIGGEQVVARVESMARGKTGGNKRLSRLMGSMTEPERQQVRGTLIDRLGRVSEGADGDDAFSATRFIGNWDKMTPQAKETLFKDGELRKSLDDIAEMAKGMGSSDKLSRYDPTNKASLGGNAAVQGAFAFHNLPVFLSGVGAQYITGRLMASPAFARMLAKAPEVKDPRTFIEGLGVIGTREPLLRNDISNLTQHLTQSMGQSPARAIAGEKEED